MQARIGLAGWAFRTAPAFWERYKEDLKRDVRSAPDRPAPRVWPDTGLHGAWIGHTTVLLKIDGFTILTDPVFSTRVGLNFGPMTLGLKRLVAPAIRRAELPKIDLILLSHAHFDHWDMPSLRDLEDRHTVVVTASNTSDLLRVRRYGAVRELGWGETVRVGPAVVRAIEVKHWGARMRRDTHRGYNGYTIEVGRRRILFGGDTAQTSAFHSLKSHRPFDLAIMPIGAYDPWIHYHCTPEQAWQMAEDAGFELFLPVHHQTFQLSREPYLEPIGRVYDAAGPHPDRVVIDGIGQEFRLT